MLMQLIQSIPLTRSESEGGERMVEASRKRTLSHVYLVTDELSMTELVRQRHATFFCVRVMLLIPHGPMGQL